MILEHCKVPFRNVALLVQEVINMFQGWMRL